jgi:inhibitor of Bruton tyrosine kinase
MVPEMFPVLGASPQNLADIIAQQTSEQAALNAKALPRSLKEIQEEEQFLQWWEQESQRIKDEEELLAKAAEISMREGRGRGSRGRGGRGRGGRGRGERGRGDFGKGESTRGPVHNRGK